ncbi:hypothetical protein Tco_0026522 [Tanacetum coccineum]
MILIELSADYWFEVDGFRDCEQRSHRQAGAKAGRRTRTGEEERPGDGTGRGQESRAGEMRTREDRGKIRRRARAPETETGEGMTKEGEAGVRCYRDEWDDLGGSNDTSHNLASEVIFDHEPEQNESSITFSTRIGGGFSLHHELLLLVELFITSFRIFDREFWEYLSLNSVIESLPVSPIPVEDSEPAQEEIDIFLVPDDLIPPGAENDDSKDEDNELPNLDHQDDPSIRVLFFYPETTRCCEMF